jgi:hypothetical protein
VAAHVVAKVVAQVVVHVQRLWTRVHFEIRPGEPDKCEAECGYLCFVCDSGLLRNWQLGN